MILLKQEKGNLFILKSDEHDISVNPSHQKTYEIGKWTELTHSEITKKVVRFHSILDAKKLAIKINRNFNRDFQPIEY